MYTIQVISGDKNFGRFKTPFNASKYLYKRGWISTSDLPPDKQRKEIMTHYMYCLFVGGRILSYANIIPLETNKKEKLWSSDMFTETSKS